MTQDLKPPIQGIVDEFSIGVASGLTAATLSVSTVTLQFIILATWLVLLVLFRSEGARIRVKAVTKRVAWAVSQVALTCSRAWRDLPRKIQQLLSTLVELALLVTLFLIGLGLLILLSYAAPKNCSFKNSKSHDGKPALHETKPECVSSEYINSPNKYFLQETHMIPLIDEHGTIHSVNQEERGQELATWRPRIKMHGEIKGSRVRVDIDDTPIWLPWPQYENMAYLVHACRLSDDGSTDFGLARNGKVKPGMKKDRESAIYKACERLRGSINKAFGKKIATSLIVPARNFTSRYCLAVLPEQTLIMPSFLIIRKGSLPPKIHADLTGLVCSTP